MDQKRRKEEGRAVADFLSSSVWTVILAPEIRRRCSTLVVDAATNLDSHPRLAGALKASMELADFENWLVTKARDAELDLAAEPDTGPNIEQEG